MAIEANSLILYLILLITLLSCYWVISGFFIRKYVKINRDSKKKDNLPLAHASAFLFFGLGRLFLAIFDVITEFDRVNYNLSNFYLWKIGSGIQILGYGIFFALMEKRVLKGRDKYSLIILYASFTIIGLIMPDVELATSFIIIAMIFSSYILFAYFYIAKVSDGDVRRKAMIIVIGFVLMIIGSLLPGEQILAAITLASGLGRIQVHQVAFVIITAGCLFLFKGTK